MRIARPMEQQEFTLEVLRLNVSRAEVMSTSAQEAAPKE